MSEEERCFLLREDSIAGIHIELYLRSYDKTLQPDYAIVIQNTKTGKQIETRDFQFFYMADAEYDYLATILYLVDVRDEK